MAVINRDESNADQISSTILFEGESDKESNGQMVNYMQIYMY